jgi:hypothetical protein
MSESTATPTLRIITPDATPEEVAAIVAVLSSLGGPAPSSPRRRSAWSDPSRRTRAMMTPGVGAWRASALPR